VTDTPTLLRAGDRGWLVECPGLSPAVLAREIAAQRWAAELQEIVPAASTVLVIVRDASRSDALRTVLGELIDGAGQAPLTDAGTGRTVAVPVRYDGADLPAVAERTGLTIEEIARAHSDAEHRVAFFGFAPGFAYIDGVPDALRVPRLDSPRPRVPAGVLAIAGGQSVVYPGGTPGGWSQIGTAELELWNPDATPPNRLRVGDRIVFRRADR
jgi:KipI family sensor histidine kinase inhibitor